MVAKVERDARAVVRALFAVALVVAVAGPAAAQPAGEPAWVAEKEAQARELVRQAGAERQAYLDAGETGPRTFQETFRQAADLLLEIVGTAPTARRLYGLAFARFHSGDAERAHYACDRVAREFAGEADVLQRCEALTAVLHGEVYRVLIDSEPQGAAVTVEGWPETEATRTPGVLWLRGGQRVLVFRLDGYVPQTQTVVVEPGFVTQVKAQLQTVPTTGRLEIVVQPAGARVLIDGAIVALPEDGVLGLPAGPHTVRLEADGFVPQEERVVVPAGELASRWYELEPVGAVAEPAEPERPYWEQPEEAEGPGHTTQWWLGLSGMVVGSAAIVTGGVLHGLAASKADEASGVPNLPDRRAEFESARDEARSMETAAWALYGSGAAILATGVVLFVLDEGPATEGEGTTVTPTAFQGGAGVTWTTRF